MDHGLPWMKVWDNYYTRRQHSALSGIDLAVGLRCTSLANANPRDDDGTAWVRSEGLPLSVEAIAREARFSVEETRTALSRLCAVGYLCERGGAWGVPRIDDEQETASAGRMRRMRAKRRNGAGNVARNKTGETGRSARNSDAGGVTVTHKRGRGEEGDPVSKETGGAGGGRDDPGRVLERLRVARETADTAELPFIEQAEAAARRRLELRQTEAREELAAGGWRLPEDKAERRARRPHRRGALRRQLSLPLGHDEPDPQLPLWAGGKEERCPG